MTSFTRWLTRAGRALPLLAALALLCAACAPVASPTATTAASTGTEPTATVAASSTASSAAGLTEQSLRNGTYDLPDVGQVVLQDGVYESKTGEGATQAVRVDLDSFAVGDLNGDGQADAVVVLVAQTGGSGSFYYLVAVIDDAGAARQAASALLGDRVRMQRLAIEGGVVAVEDLVAGPNDPLCCPSQLTSRTYRLQGSVLELLTQVVATATPAA